MRKFLVILQLVLCMTAISQEKRCTLEVEINGFENNDGHARLVIFNSAKYWPDNDKHSFRKAEGEIKGGISVFRFEDMPYGTFAIAVLHDENDNLKMDYNFLGMPTEDYGFSNNKRGTLGAPSFAECSFIIDTSKKKLKIKVE